MSNNQRGQRPPISEGEHEPRGSEDYGVIRIIAGVIHWWSKSDTWINDPTACRRWADRQAAYACAQSMRGLLVVGCGLADLERADPRMSPMRHAVEGSRTVSRIQSEARA